MAQHILYIPGLGDHNHRTQTFILKLWRRKNLRAEFIPMNWRAATHESYEQKLTRVLAKIDSLPKNEKVFLVGVSAGGSMALNTYVERKDRIAGVVFVCAKLRHPEKINPVYFQKNPAFEKSVFTANANIAKLTAGDKSKILTIHSFYDWLIPGEDSEIPGVPNRTVLMPFHILAIIWIITLHSFGILNFFKAQTE